MGATDLCRRCGRNGERERQERRRDQGQKTMRHGVSVDRGHRRATVAGQHAGWQTATAGFADHAAGIVESFPTQPPHLSR